MATTPATAAWEAREPAGPAAWRYPPAALTVLWGVTPMGCMGLVTSKQTQPQRLSRVELGPDRLGLGPASLD